MRLLWLPEVLRAAGLTVHEVEGWRTRGADSYGPVHGITIHGTGGSARRSDAGEIDTLLNGSTSAPPPIAQLYLGRQGHWWVVASGTCNHNLVGWGGPNAGYGNDTLLGIEAAHNNRDDPWPAAQYPSYVRGVAALVAHKARGYDVAVDRVAGHKEHQPGDKVDPTFDMDRFRRDVQEDDVITDADADRLIGRLLNRTLGKTGPTVAVALQSGYRLTEQIATKVDIDPTELAAITAAAESGAAAGVASSVDELVNAVVEKLPAGGLTKDDVEDALRSVLRAGVG